MKRARLTADLVGLSTLTFGKLISPRSKGESADANDKRCWRERCHTDEDGYVIWPASAFKLMLITAARLRALKVPGKGQGTFATRFKTGVMVDPDYIPTYVYTVKNGKEEKIHVDDMIGRAIHVPSDGKAGGSKRVWKTFPELDPPWVIHIGLMILNADLIEHQLATSSKTADTNKVVSATLELAGIETGIGCHRPSGSSGGDHGIFLVENFKFEVIA